MKPLSGWARLGIVAAAAAVLSVVLPLLQIRHFTPFNSGVSTVIGLLALGWLVYSVVAWVAAGFRNKRKPSPPQDGWNGPA